MNSESGSERDERHDNGSGEARRDGSGPRRFDDRRGFRGWDGPRRDDRGSRHDDREGGFRGGPRRDDREGGFRRDDREGGYRGGPRRDSRDGGFRRDDREGGFRGGPRRDSRDGGFRRDDREGGYRGGPRRDDREGGYCGGPRRDDRAPLRDRTPEEIDARRAQREAEPPLDDAITAKMLDGQTRASLRTLNKENADVVARHLVASGLAIDSDPELAYQHAMAAQRRAGRVDMVREAVATAAYLTGRYSEALREARTVRRLSGTESLRAIEADCERGLGRPEKALAVIAEVNQAEQPAALRTELAIVESGARADLGEFEAGLLAVDSALAFIRDPELRARLLSVRADRLDDLGRSAEAEEARTEMTELLDAAEEPDDAVLFIDDALDEEIELAAELEEAEDAESEDYELAPLPPEERAEHTASTDHDSDGTPPEGIDDEQATEPTAAHEAADQPGNDTTEEPHPSEEDEA